MIADGLGFRCLLFFCKSAIMSNLADRAMVAGGFGQDGE